MHKNSNLKEYRLKMFSYLKGHTVQRKMKHRLYVSTFSVLTFLFFFALTHINPPVHRQEFVQQ